MVMTIDIPESIVSEAALRGVPVEAIIQERLSRSSDYVSRPGFRRFGTSEQTPAKAAADIRDLRLGQTLGSDVTIRQLIEEGRRP